MRSDFPPEIIEDLIEQFEFGDAESLGAIERKGLGKASGGVIPDQEIMNYATGGRVNFDEGSPKPQLEGNDFLNELEFKFNNIDSVTLDDTPITYDDSKSKIAQFNDLLNPRNIPYYADMAAQAALRVGEFGARVLPATGNLISDILQKPMFKVKSSYLRDGDNEILDYGEIPENTSAVFQGLLRNTKKIHDVCVSEGRDWYYFDQPYFFFSDYQQSITGDRWYRVCKNNTQKNYLEKY